SSIAQGIRRSKANRPAGWCCVPTVDHLHGVTVLPTTKRTAREAARMSSEDRSDLSALPLPAISWDTNFCVTGWNAAAESLFGWNERDATAQDLCDLLWPIPVQGEVRERLGKVLDGHGTQHYVDELFCRRGMPIICELSHTVARHPSGAATGVVS